MKLEGFACDNCQHKIAEPFIKLGVPGKQFDFCSYRCFWNFIEHRKGEFIMGDEVKKYDRPRSL